MMIAKAKEKMKVDIITRDVADHIQTKKDITYILNFGNDYIDAFIKHLTPEYVFTQDMERCIKVLDHVKKNCSKEASDHYFSLVYSSYVDFVERLKKYL
jgi:hypothetical protein